MSAKVRLTKIFEFDAAHSLPHHNGKCANIHGHTYKLEVTVEGYPKLEPHTSSDSMVVDYYDIKEVVEKLILKRVDHKYLNEVFAFRTTVENLALEFLSVLRQAKEHTGINFIKIKLWESPTSYCEVGDF